MPFSPLCFWHPVGPHIGETLAQIFARKRDEIARYGYTLWSFAPVAPERVTAWRVALAAAAQARCDVVCCGDNVVDPQRVPAPAIWMHEKSSDAPFVVWVR